MGMVIRKVAACVLLCLAVGGTAPAAGFDRHWVLNPTSGARLLVQVVLPTGYSGGSIPGLVLVPGGRGDSSSFLKSTPGGSEAQELADHGFAVVVFDPDGRGESEGTEDDNGYVHQDGLAAVIAFAATLSAVDPARLGLVSYSYGVTMATGALARYPDLPILFYIDWEGPANRNDTGGCDADKLGHLQGHPCDDEAFWSEREASAFALTMDVPYQRLQSRVDHVQPDVEHAILLIANATSEAYGGHGNCPWTRLNDLAANRIYTAANPPVFPARDLNLQAVVGDYAVELLALFGP
jgi:pimeloyl-ACP methyl ester carboxylesterase